MGTHHPSDVGRLSGGSHRVLSVCLGLGGSVWAAWFLPVQGFRIRIRFSGL